MTHSRRDFLKTAAVGGALLAAKQLIPGQASAMELSVGKTRRALDVLVLGGTGFIGPHLVRHAVARGHKVTIFTRGRHDADLPAGVARLTGDRNGQLDSLKGTRWDAVIDDSANTPEWVVSSTELLKDAAGAYLFTSSTGVFYPYLQRGLGESAPIHYEPADPKNGDEAFGVAKARCERQVFQAFGDRGIVVRPTYIVGPGDTSDRFPYWPVRLARGGEVLAPGHKDDPMQIIDVRDLAEFMIRILEDGQRGVFNVAGPAAPLTAAAFYPAAVTALDATVTLTPVDDYDFLAAHKIDEAIPWAMLKGNDYGMMSVNAGRAIGAGLTFRPLATTLRDTWAWWPSVPEARRAKPRFTISPETEAKALADWHALGR